MAIKKPTYEVTGAVEYLYSDNVRFITIDLPTITITCDTEDVHINPFWTENPIGRLLYKIKRFFERKK